MLGSSAYHFKPNSEQSLLFCIISQPCFLLYWISRSLPVQFLVLRAQSLIYSPSLPLHLIFIPTLRAEASLIALLPAFYLPALPRTQSGYRASLPYSLPPSAEAPGPGCPPKYSITQSFLLLVFPSLHLRRQRLLPLLIFLDSLLHGKPESVCFNCFMFLKWDITSFFVIMITV